MAAVQEEENRGRCYKIAIFRIPDGNGCRITGAMVVAAQKKCPLPSVG